MPLTPAQQTAALLLLQETDAPHNWASVVSAISIAAMDQGHDAATAEMMGKFAAHSLGLKLPRTGAHGGARRGAGRKPLSPQGLERTTVTLPPDLLAAAEQIGAGNVSDGVRVALLHWLADNAPAPRELQIWRHAPTGAYYLILWQGGARRGSRPHAAGGSAGCPARACAGTRPLARLGGLGRRRLGTRRDGARWGRP